MLGTQTMRMMVMGLVAMLVTVALFAPMSAQAAPNGAACWGQATKVFAQMGEMGKHSSQMPTPRLGLKNLANLLYEQGVLAEPTLQALGQFVAAELGLSIDACQ